MRQYGQHIVVFEVAEALRFCGLTGCAEMPRLRSLLERLSAVRDAAERLEQATRTKGNERQWTYEAEQRANELFEALEAC